MIWQIKVLVEGFVAACGKHAGRDGKHTADNYTVCQSYAAPA